MDLVRVLQALNQALALRTAYQALLGDIPPAIELVLARFENITLGEYVEAPVGDACIADGLHDSAHRITAFSLRPEALEELRRVAAQFRSQQSQ